jgi:hypothetical protein
MLQLMKRKIWIGCWLLFSTLMQAQYDDSPMKGVRWNQLSVGLNSSDYQSWNMAAVSHQRGESALVSQRLSYSQEWVSSPVDSILSPKNRQLEMALMVGEGWKGKRKDWWLATGVGMSLNARMFANFKPQSSTEIEYLTKFTMGAAAHLEAGWMLSNTVGVLINGYGNWNFRQPYWGCNLGVSYRPKIKVKKQE